MTLVRAGHTVRLWALSSWLVACVLKVVTRSNDEVRVLELDLCLDILLCHIDIDNTAKHKVIFSSGLGEVSYVTNICSLTRLLDAIGYFTNFVRRWNGNLCSILLKLSALLISPKYPIDRNVCSQFFSWSAKANSPARSVGFLWRSFSQLCHIVWRDRERVSESFF